jgi:hypothetical protein
MRAVFAPTDLQRRPRRLPFVGEEATPSLPCLRTIEVVSPGITPSLRAMSTSIDSGYRGTSYGKPVFTVCVVISSLVK